MMAHAVKAMVVEDESGQHITIPSQYRLSAREVYLERNPVSGLLTVSETPPLPTMREVLLRLREAGAADLDFERDRSLPEDRELL